MESQPTVSQTKHIDIPIAPLWGLIQDFGNWIKWYPLFLSMDLKGQGEGAVRTSFTILGHTYEDVLKEVNAAEHRIRYDNVSIKPAIVALDSLSSTVELTAIDEKNTQITWKAWAKFAPGADQALREGFIKLQAEAFGKGVKAIVQYCTLSEVWKEGFALVSQRVQDFTKALLMGQTPTWQYAEYTNAEGKVIPMPKMVRGLPVSEAMPPRKIGATLGRFLEVGYLAAAEAVFERIQKLPEGTDDYEIAAKQLVDIYGKPSDIEMTNYLTKHWNNDDEFCQQLLAGCNPLLIKLVRHLDEVPQPMRHLKANGHSVTELVHSKRLYILDYKDLVPLKPNPPLIFMAPYVLVYRDFADSKLAILGIQLERTEHAHVYTPESANKNRYTLAKMICQSADNQVHEFRYHLGASHLSIEPIIIAVHNVFPEDNPIRRFLKPHFSDTIGINFLARNFLVAKQNAFTQHTFAVGTSQGLALASVAWQNWDFYKYSFPEDLKARGFDEAKSDGLNFYHYRDDGFKLWHIIGKYTTNFVNKHYSNDDAVKNDKLVQAWAEECADPKRAAVTGFKKSIDCKHSLAEILQIIIWNGSALHSALNFPQWPYLGYIPNRPNGIFAPMPAEDGKDITQEYIQSALNPPLQTLFQLTFSWLLSMPSEYNLLNLGEKYKENDDVHKIFHDDLVELTKELEKRNDKLRAEGKAPYPYFLPENVACSVDI